MTTAPARPPGASSLAGNRAPKPHRLVLSTGRTLTGNVFRAPGGRLADHLSTLKGFIAVTDAVYEDDRHQAGFLVVNLAHLVAIEEIGGERDAY